jgi:hypothetical protein
MPICLINSTLWRFAKKIIYQKPTKELGHVSLYLCPQSCNDAEIFIKSDIYDFSIPQELSQFWLQQNRKKTDETVQVIFMAY